MSADSGSSFFPVTFSHSPTSTSAEKSSNLSREEIVGMVIAAVFVIVLSVLLGFFIQKECASRAQRQHRSADDKKAESHEMHPSASTVEVLSDPLCAEADSSLRHHEAASAMRYEKGISKTPTDATGRDGYIEL